MSWKKFVFFWRVQVRYNSDQKGKKSLLVLNCFVLFLELDYLLMNEGTFQNYFLSYASIDFVWMLL